MDTTSLQVTNDLQAANFSAIKDNSTLQINLICKLLSASISSKAPITRNDITNLYTEWKFTGRDTVGISLYRCINGKYDDYLIQHNQEEFKKHYTTETKAKQWFKSNLGAAIIKGRLLVIPVINI